VADTARAPRRVDESGEVACGEGAAEAMPPPHEIGGLDSAARRAARMQ
jgi:hypothetical protein